MAGKYVYDGTKWVATDKPANPTVSTAATKPAAPTPGEMWIPDAQTGLLFCVGLGEYGISVDGSTWQAGSTLGKTADTYSDIVWCPELGILVAIASSDPGDIAVSKDGMIWNHISPPGSFAKALAWCPQIGIFVLGSMNGLLYTSPDAVTWTNRTSNFGTNTINTISWSPQLGRIVAAGAGTLATSEDGITWTTRTSSLGADQITASAWSPEKGLFIIGSGSGATATSPDGITWTKRATPSSYSINKFAWSPTLGLAALVMTTSSSNNIYTSPDLLTWTARTSQVAANLWSVTWSAQLAMFIAVGSSGNITTSPDGITWTKRTSWTTTKTILDVCAIPAPLSSPRVQVFTDTWHDWPDLVPV